MYIFYFTNAKLLAVGDTTYPYFLLGPIRDSPFAMTQIACSGKAFENVGG